MIYRTNLGQLMNFLDRVIFTIMMPKIMVIIISLVTIINAGHSP